MDRKVLEDMLSQGQDNAMLRYTLGTLCLKEGLLESAVEHLEQALQQNDKHSASWKAYGKALVAAKQNDAARQAYEKGIVVAESLGDIQAAKEMKVFLRRLT
ncbi:hypothetical protein DJ030_11415 [bacterium endosymbiont of Escarpia laminata]|nr:MAG: hypothetical protein DJ030_11415 [bacterium endosymbiont of Escarpia laminata]RLJ21347.1 MAG: hypothetical protein DJ031_03375 [bacterium endosymbiont of Escarpia laminata]